MFSQNDLLPEFKASRTTEKINIDGYLNESIWKNSDSITTFRQYEPVNNAKPTFPSSFKIIYNDDAVYIGAMLYDSSPDSILKQLGDRDDELNADAIGISFDTYNTQYDAFYFQLSASNVQYDWRQADETYNAIWESKVQISKQGWSAEIKIPYSAIRFPKKESQQWRMQIWRNIRRYRETDQWVLEDKGAENNLHNYGTLSGIDSINIPVRLSLTPYISFVAEHYPAKETEIKDWNHDFKGGVDLKYGINEGYTLDMILMPDFSQVQSDKVIKNLSAHEIEYDENRPFFKEAVELFENGDVFYSRRIGGTPLKYHEIESLEDEGYKIIHNPQQGNLLNATKISGRDKKGLALGVLNGITDNMYASVQDSFGNKRNILTNPLSNYNVAVINKSFKNNSSFFITNTNVWRDKQFEDANVSVGGINLVDKSTTYQISAFGGLSHITDGFDTTLERNGYKSEFSFTKLTGNFKFYTYNLLMDNKYDDNDLGITLTNNKKSTFNQLSYNIYEPFWIMRNMYNFFYFEYEANYLTNKPSDASVNYKFISTLKNYLTLWLIGTYWFNERYDYYEPRVDGRYYLEPPAQMFYFGFSSDYRNKLAIDADFTYFRQPMTSNTTLQYSLEPIVRLNDKFRLSNSTEISNDDNDKGYVNDTDSAIYFGNRDIFSVTNTFQGKYLFKNDLSLSFKLRHYWSAADYDRYYRLSNDGKLEYEGAYNEKHNFNFNSFNIDLVFNWQFAQGSYLNLIWKNSILDEGKHIYYNYLDNLNNTVSKRQINTFAVKILYYLDYNYIFKRKRHGNYRN